MTVVELIGLLNGLPRNARVMHLWDGEPRSEIEHVWLSKDGDVVTADHGDVCYSDGGRPVGAPTPDDEPYWSSSRM